MAEIFDIENLQDTRFTLSEDFDPKFNTLKVELTDTTANIVIAGYEIERANRDERRVLSRQTEIPKGLELFTESIYSHMPNQGIGLALWQYGELSFAKLYKGAYLKLTYDSSKDLEGLGRKLWTSKRLPYLLSYLESNGVEISPLWSGNLGMGLPAWLYLCDYKGI